MEVNLRSADNANNGAPGKAVAVDGSGNSIIANENPNREKLIVTPGGQDVTLIYGPPTASGSTRGHGSGAVLRSNGPPFSEDRYNGIVVAIGAVPSVVGVIEY